MESFALDDELTRISLDEMGEQAYSGIAPMGAKRRHSGHSMDMTPIPEEGQPKQELRVQTAGRSDNRDDDPERQKELPSTSVVNYVPKKFLANASEMSDDNCRVQTTRTGQLRLKKEVLVYLVVGAILHSVFGVTLIIIEAIQVSNDYYVISIYSGLWCGSMILIPGVISAALAIMETAKYIKVYMGLCGVASMFATKHCFIQAVALAEEEDVHGPEVGQTAVALHGTALAVAALEVIFCLVVCFVGIKRRYLIVPYQDNSEHCDKAAILADSETKRPGPSSWITRDARGRSEKDNPGYSKEIEQVGVEVAEDSQDLTRRQYELFSDKDRMGDDDGNVETRHPNTYTIHVPHE